MGLSTKKQNEISVWEYFAPNNIEWNDKSDEDITKFFEWSEQGKHRLYIEDLSYFNKLRQGKRWAGIHMHELYEKGVLDGTMPYYVILGGYPDDVPPPRQVVDFIKKEMFKGADSDLIEETYQLILEEKL